MPKLPKTREEWSAMVFHQLWVKVILVILTAAMAFVWSQGKGIVVEKVLEIVKPSMDTLAKKQESTEQKVDKVDAKVDALISILVEAFPQVKKAAQERNQKNRDSQDVQDALSGDTK